MRNPFRKAILINRPLHQARLHTMNAGSINQFSSIGGAGMTTAGHVNHRFNNIVKENS
jgi:hypothetical protein